MFRVNPKFSDLTPTQYMAALDWLSALGIVIVDGGRPRLTAGPDRPVGGEDLLGLAIQHVVPDWLQDFDQFVDDSDLPLDLLEMADDLGVGSDQAWKVANRIAVKVDAQARAEVGAAGELALVELLSSCLDARVQHVSTESDAYGYDIAVSGDAGIWHLETKSTTRRGRLIIYLSRHEFETARIDSDWRLVVVLLDASYAALGVATVRREWIFDVVPEDHSPLGRWESIRLSPPREALEAGLSGIGECLKPDMRDTASASLLQGRFGPGVPLWMGPSPLS